MKHTTFLSLGIACLIIFQSYRLSDFSTTMVEDTRDQKIFETKPCQNIQTSSLHQVSSMNLLISNCWPILQGNTDRLRSFLFPKEFMQHIANTPRLYDITLYNKTSLQLDNQEKFVISGFLDMDEHKRIQGLHLFCTYPSLITQVQRTPITKSQKFDAMILKHCQNHTINELQYFFFDPSSTPMTSSYLETLYASDR